MAQLWTDSFETKNIIDIWLDGTKEANILDPVQESLDSDVFDNAHREIPTLKPRIEKWVTNHIHRLIQHAGWKNSRKLFRLALTGSLTSYQWSPKSDFDVSVFPDYMHIPESERAALISLLMTHLDGLKVPGTTHPLQVYVVPHNVTHDDLYKAGLRSAWDLDTSHWIVPPEKDRAQDVYSAFPALIAVAKLSEDKMRLLMKYEPEAAEDYWKDIHKKRRADMAAGGGDFSESNIIYKWLENRDAHPTRSAA